MNVFLYSCLIIHHAKRMHRIILSSVVCLTLSYSSTLPHKLHDLRKKILNIKFELLFSLYFLFELTLIPRIIQEHIIINVQRSSDARTDVRTDKHNKVSRCFRNFTKTPKNSNQRLELQPEMGTVGRE